MCVWLSELQHAAVTLATDWDARVSAGAVKISDTNESAINERVYLASYHLDWRSREIL